MAPTKRPLKDQNAPTIPTRRSPRLAATLNNNTTDPEQPKPKKAKKSPKKAKQPPPPSPAPSPPPPSSPPPSKTIIIEHCKQCNSFKTRALQVKNGLEKGVVGVNVLVNPEKPRKGCFEIREENGETFVSLLDMKRPFPPLKKLDMDDVIADVIEKIK